MSRQWLQRRTFRSLIIIHPFFDIKHLIMSTQISAARHFRQINNAPPPLVIPHLVHRQSTRLIPGINTRYTPPHPLRCHRHEPSRRLLLFEDHSLFRVFIRDLLPCHLRLPPMDLHAVLYLSTSDQRHQHRRLAWHEYIPHFSTTEQGTDARRQVADRSCI
jgi:hypothetical protein